MGHSGKGASLHVKLQARPYVEEALGVIVEIMRDPEAPTPSRLAAAVQIVDRAWGKPKETLEIDNPSEGLRTVLAGVSSSDLVELMRVLKAGAVEAPRDVTPLPDVIALPSNPEK